MLALLGFDANRRWSTETVANPGNDGPETVAPRTAVRGKVVRTKSVHEEGVAGVNSGVLACHVAGETYWESTTLACLQGLANREEANLLYVYDEMSDEAWYRTYPIPDERPLYEWYGRYDGVRFDDYDDPFATFEKLSTLPYAGYVVVDERAPVTVNVAANYASLEGLLPVTAAMVDRGRVPDAEVVYDLRERHGGVDFRTDSRRDVYQWVYDHQWPEANHDLVANLGTPAGPDDAGPNDFFTSNRSRDVTIAEGGVFVDLSSATDGSGERDLKDAFLSEVTEGGLCFGWHTPRCSERRHIEHCSAHGVLSMGATTYAANLSFHSRFEPPGDPVRRFRERGRRPISTDGPAEKIYLSAVVSDGDSLNFVLRRVFGGMWLHEDRGTVPIGWELSPLLERFGPGILDYLQATATENDDFLSGPSGLGYFYPGDMAEGVLRHTLRRTRDAVEALGLTETTVMHPRTHRTRGIYNEELGDVLDGAVDGYVGKEAETAPIVFGSGFVWTPAALPITHRLANDANDLKRPLEWLAAATDVRPLFVPIHVPAHKLTMMDVVELDRQLDDEAFEFLPPNQFFAWAASAGADRLVDAAGFG